MRKLVYILGLLLLISCEPKHKCVNIKSIPISGIVISEGPYYLVIQSKEDIQKFQVDREIYMYVSNGDTINKDTIPNIKFIKR